MNDPQAFVDLLNQEQESLKLEIAVPLYL